MRLVCHVARARPGDGQHDYVNSLSTAQAWNSPMANLGRVVDESFESPGNAPRG